MNINSGSDLFPAMSAIVINYFLKNKYLNKFNKKVFCQSIPMSLFRDFVGTLPTRPRNGCFFFLIVLILGWSIFTHVKELCAFFLIVVKL